MYYLGIFYRNDDDRDVEFDHESCTKVPMLIYQIPGIFPLVPGGQAYQVVRSLVTGDRVTATTNFELLVIIIGAIAAGFWSAELLNRLRGMNRLT